jgi:secondary thiamine-phosphate synthase enzyme
MTFTRRLSFHLEAEFGHRDVTPEVTAAVQESGVRDGIACVQLVGSTGAVTTIEYESGALADLQRAVEQLAPAAGRYAHNDRWHDGNGFSHVRSALLKTGVSVPIVDGELQLGTWQQLTAINMDNRARKRELVVVVVGEA